MLLNNTYLRSFPKVFRALTGLNAPEFNRLVLDILPRWEKAEHQHLSWRQRKRDIGGGPHFELSMIDQLPPTVIRLRRYPIQEVLGFLFGVSDTTAGCYHPTDVVPARKIRTRYDAAFGSRTPTAADPGGFVQAHPRIESRSD